MNATESTFRAVNPATGEELEPAYAESTAEDVDRALAAAQEAFDQCNHRESGWSAHLLDAIAAQIEALGDGLIQRAMSETALPQPRLIGERARTVNQLKMFAGIVREGSWVEGVIDTADPTRQPMPRPDLRRMLKPRGPVVVFGASNFPFAFGSVGGDTASALAAGNPVIVKGHPSHPGTSELFAKAVDAAVAQCKLPKGLFTLLQGRSHELSAQLVKHPLTTSVGFTGSLKAGRALFDMAGARPNPIPVYAEMGSLNPIVVLPEATIEGAVDEKALVASMLLGGGQFCTKPGLLLVLQHVGFIESLAKVMAQSGATVTMLNRSLRDNFCNRTSDFSSIPGVKTLLRGGPQGHAQMTPMLLETSAQVFQTEPRLREEIFGPGALIVRCESIDEVIQCLNVIEGSLTATVHMGALEDRTVVQRIVHKLDSIAGRVIVNGYPTGVEVNNAIVHGGPYPATTDPNSTSVGSAAIRRFVRMIAYQDTPDELLPPALKNTNPLGIERIINGRRTRDPI